MKLYFLFWGFLYLHGLFSDFIVAFEHDDVVLTRCFGVLNSSRVSIKRGTLQISLGEREGSSKKEETVSSSNRQVPFVGRLRASLSLDSNPKSKPFSAIWYYFIGEI